MREASQPIPVIRGALPFRSAPHVSRPVEKRGLLFLFFLLKLLTGLFNQRHAALGN